MEGFTLTLALFDAVPVILFGISMMIIAGRFGSPMFISGGVLSLLAGCFKVLWKLILGVSKKDIVWLNKSFVPLQCTGFLLILLSFILDFRRIQWEKVMSRITSVPALLFFILWLVMMGVMVWYRKKRFQRDDARKNWTAQIINAAGQTALFLGILFA